MPRMGNREPVARHQAAHRPCGSGVIAVCAVLAVGAIRAQSTARARRSITTMPTCRHSRAPTSRQPGMTTPPGGPATGRHGPRPGRAPRSSCPRRVPGRSPSPPLGPRNWCSCQHPDTTDSRPAAERAAGAGRRSPTIPIWDDGYPLSHTAFDENHEMAHDIRNDRVEYGLKPRWHWRISLAQCGECLRVYPNVRGNSEGTPPEIIYEFVNNQ